MEKIFKIGQELESGNYYRADQKEYHIHLEDTVEIHSKRCTGLHAVNTSDALNVFVKIDGKKDITIDFGGAKLVFYGRIQPFLITDSDNITIKNVSVSYNRPPYTEFEVMERSDDYVLLRPLDKKCTFFVEDGYLIMTGENWENRLLHKEPHFFQAFDMQTREGKGLALAIVGKEIELDPKYPFRVKQYIPSMCGEYLKLEGDIWDVWTKGSMLCYTHEQRNLSSVYTFDSNNITIDNYRIINGAGMGISTNHSSNIYINDLKLVFDEQSNGIIANAADTIHSIACSGDYVITNSIIEGMVDDGLNIHGVFCNFKSAENNIMYLKNKGHTSAYLGFFGEGEKIAVYNGPTMEKTAEYTVKSVEVLDKKNIKLELYETVGAHNEDDLVENLSTQTDITIKNTRFGKANSHIRFQSRGKILVENCEIGLPVLLTGDASYWFESSPVQDLTFKNVSFNTERAEIRLMPEVMPTEKEPYYHKNVKFIDCDFAAEIPVHGGYTDNIVFENVKNSLSKQMKLVLTNCGEVTADGIEIERKTEIKTELKVN